MVDYLEMKDIWLEKHDKLNGFTWCNGNGRTV